MDVDSAEKQSPKVVIDPLSQATPCESPDVADSPELHAASAAEALPADKTSQALIDASKPVDTAVGPGEKRKLTKEEREAEIQDMLNCPCMEDMRKGSCGPTFLTAFECFLRSEDEPKGMECGELFIALRNCFAEHPEEYDDGFDTLDGENAELGVSGAVPPEQSGGDENAQSASQAEPQAEANPTEVKVVDSEPPRPPPAPPAIAAASILETAARRTLPSFARRSIARLFSQ